MQADGRVRRRRSGSTPFRDGITPSIGSGTETEGLAANSAAAPGGDLAFDGSNQHETLTLGSGRQTADGNAGWDRIISYGDAGEPDPAQTDGADGRVNPALADGAADDLLIGGSGGDTFEFRALINAKDHVIEEYTGEDGRVNWRGVAGENDNVHDHWVEGVGNDTIADYNKEEGDKIVIRGHTVEVAGIEQGEDEGGSYSLIRVISQQGDGGAGGANTATGAHDEDPLGAIKVYGDEVTLEDIIVQRDGVFDGIDQLVQADELAAYNGGSQEFGSRTGETLETSPDTVKTTDYVRLGEGAQDVHTGAGRDTITSYSDAGEPDPAQTDGADGRVNPAVADGAADDMLSGGQGADTYVFKLLINAKEEVKAEHTRSDGSIDWQGVAGENDNVHDHWVEGIGNDTITGFSNQDDDKIVIRGHTVEIAGIEHGEDEGGSYSLISLRSQQGDGGAGGANTATGAHDEDPLGTIKVYGDQVTEENIELQTENVFDGVDRLETIDDVSPAAASAAAPGGDLAFDGSNQHETLTLGSGRQTADGNAGWDRIISYGDAGEPDPAQTDGADGRVNPALADGAADDLLIGGSGGDTFEFRALINAKDHVIEEYTGEDGRVNWRGVAGENDNVHDHWVEGVGNDTIADYNKEEGDKIVIRGHTVEVAGIEQGEDEGGSYSLIRVISQQGDGGAGGANTATGAHDEDPLGAIKVYGDEVTLEDIIVQRDGVFDGIDQLVQADELAAYNGGSQEFGSRTGETLETSPDTVKTTDYVRLGEGAQDVHTGAGRDTITSYSDAGEPDPAQTDGADGRVNPAVADGAADDMLSGGQGADTYVFKLLINATDEVHGRSTPGRTDRSTGRAWPARTTMSTTTGSRASATTPSPASPTRTRT